MPAQQSSSRAATLRLVGTAVAAALVVALVVVELLTMGSRTRGAGSGSAGAPIMDSPAGGTAPSAEEPTLAGPAREALDRGNAAYRARNYRDALDAYRTAAAAAPEDAAPYFGIYMAATALDDTVLADSAMALIRAQRANGGDMLTDSSLRDLHARGAVMPAGHPAVRDSSKR